MIFEVANFGCGIVWRFVEQSDRHYGRKTAGDAALIKEIEADLSFFGVHWAVGGVPGIDGGGEGCGLLLVGCVAKEIVKRAVFGHGAEVELFDGVADAVSRIGRAVSVAGVRGFRHPDADEAEADGEIGEHVGCHAAMGCGDDPVRERNPGASGGDVDGIEAGPVLEDVVGGVGVGPGDLEPIDKLFAREVDDDPLRMERIVFTGEAAAEIRIALPVCVLVAVGDA